jgi:hypothetical protein
MNNPHPAVVAAAKVAAASCFINRKEPDMSLSNGNTVAREDRNSLSAVQMFTAAKHLEAERDTVLRDRPSLTELAKLLSDRCGFRLTESNAKNIKAMTGLEWTRKITDRKVRIRHDVKEIAAAILEVASGLGMKLSNAEAIESIASREK